MSRPNSTVLHHAIATGDLETVQSLLKQGVVDADTRLQVDEEILETASRKSYTSIRSYRQQSMANENIAEENESELTTIDDQEEENKSSETGNHDNTSSSTSSELETDEFKSSELRSENIESTEIDLEFKTASIEIDDEEKDSENEIEKIMEECQHEAEIENVVPEEETPIEDRYLKAQPIVGISTPQDEAEIIVQDDLVEDRLQPVLQRLREPDMESCQSGSSTPLLNNNRGSLADVIDLKLRDDNEGLFERAPSMRVNPMSEEGGAPKKLIPRLKRKISLKFNKKPKRDLLDEDDDDDLIYENLVKTKNVDDAQLDENFEGVAFFEAVRDGMDMIVQTLLETSDNYQLNMLDENGFTPAMNAAWHGQADCLQILIKHGANTDLRTATGCTAAHFAAGQGNAECLQLLIDDDKDQIDIKTKFGATPLILSAKGGHNECMEILLDAGADANVQYRGKQNAVLFAAGNGHYECLETLIEHEVNLNQTNSQKVTPLMRAVQQGHNTCVVLLTDKGADINLQDAIGRSALHFAVEYNNSKGLKLLLQQGANVDLKTKGGSKPLDYAERFQNTRLGEMIENHINKLREEVEKEKEIEVQKQIVEEKENKVSCLSFKHIFRRRSRKNSDVQKAV
eukprot:TCONS_00065905-protein